MPTRSEQRSIVDHGKTILSIDTAWFPNTPASFFWSASAYANNSGLAWDVYFGDGHASAYGKSYAYQVRLVRAGQ